MNRPPSASTRSASPRRPDPAPAHPPPPPIAAPPIPSSAISTVSVPAVVADGDPDLASVRVLDRVAQRLAREVVRGGLDLVGKADVEVDLEVRGQAGATAQLLESDREPALDQQRRVDALGQLAQLLERERQRGPRLAHDRRRVALVRGQLGLEQPERHRDRDQPLLRPVVKVALDPAALGVGRLDQPPP